MKPFNHVNAKSLEEAAAVLKGGKAKAIAGGADLLGTLKDNIIPEYPDTLVNLKSIPGLEYIKEEDGMLKIGALTRLADISRDETVREKCLALHQAASVTCTPNLREQATIGGNISTNAGGMRAVKYGVTRDYVRGLTVVLPDGSVEKLGGKIVKNSTGYSLLNLMIGSEGTLGVITEAILKLVPLPKITESLLVPFTSVSDGIRTVPVIIRSKASLTAIEFFERETILFSEEYLGKKFPDTRYPAYLLLTGDGSDRGVVDREMESVAKLCMEQGAADAYLVDTDERKESVWKARGAFLEAIKASTTGMDECDVVVPRSKVAEFIGYTHEIARELQVRIPSFGHAGDGNLHVYICRDGLSADDWEERLEKAFEMMYARADELNGLVSGEHGIGYAKKRYLLETCGEKQVELMRGIKRAFDPNGILNPGKLF